MATEPRRLQGNRARLVNVAAVALARARAERVSPAGAHVLRLTLVGSAALA